MKREHRPLTEILRNAESGACPAEADIEDLLRIKDGSQRRLLFATNRKLRQRYFGENIFLYGFIYTSTFCRNDCSFCFYRRSNARSTRYRKNTQEVLNAAARLTESGVHLVDLTMGEDPLFFKYPDKGSDRLAELVTVVKKAIHLPVMVSPGAMTGDHLKKLAQAGATWYACYQETHNRRLFAALRPKQNYDRRLKSKVEARRQGLLIEEGLLCGAGETCSDLMHSLSAMQELQADQVRAMTFIPQPGTPMAGRFRSEAQRETLLIAVMRLVFPDRLIPASLDVDGIEGLRRRLDAGANVVTSIVPPGSGLAGVASPSMGIEDGSRTVGTVSKALAACGLKAATHEVYERWINRRQIIEKPGLKLLDEGKKP
jgi:methylornithine synthase